MAISEGSKERVKLRATYINNIAVGFFLVGFLAPVIAAATTPSAGLVAPQFAPIGILGIVLSAVLHMYAQKHLSETDRDE